MWFLLENRYKYSKKCYDLYLGKYSNCERAQMFGCLKESIYFCIKSVIYCTMKYGELIKERRTVLGLTQQDLSDYTELSLRIIKSVESEKGNPSLKTLEKIAEVLGLELIMRVKIINE